MNTMRKLVAFVKCLRCGYEWTPLVRRPKTCARCKRYDWEDDGPRAGGARSRTKDA